MNLHEAILEHNPQAVFAVEGDAITHYEGGPMPTPEELAAAWERVLSRRQAAAALSEARRSMAALFDGLADDTRAAFYGLRLSVEQALDRGDLALARRLVEIANVPAELAATRAQILEMMQPH